MSVARFAFGPRLKAHRERKGITLQDIADSTKIGISLLSGLERNDVSQWPRGIFRRAFLRSYARAIDIPFEATWTEFVQLFPEDGTPAVLARAEESPLRLVLASTRSQPIAPSLSHAIAAALDLSLVIAIGTAVSFASSASIAASIAVVSMIYMATSTVLVGGSLSRWYLRGRTKGRPRSRSDHDPVELLQPSLDRAPLTLEPDMPGAPPAQPARPRIVAVAPHATATGEPRERRVADR